MGELEKNRTVTTQAMEHIHNYLETEGLSGSGDTTDNDDISQSDPNIKPIMTTSTTRRSKQKHSSMNSTRIEKHNLKTRNKIEKPEDEQLVHHYGHKEDIFKEFEKSKHNHKLSKEVTKLKELEEELRKQTDNEGDEISGE